MATKGKVRKAPVKSVKNAATKPAEKIISVSQTTQTPRITIKKSHIIIALIILGAIILLYLLRSYFVVATVNGHPISRTAYNAELEREARDKSLSTLVTKTLILQEADKQHVSVSQNEISTEEKKVETQVKQQGQKLDDLLKQRGLTRSDLEEQIRIQKIIEKLLGKQVKVSDQELNDYMDKNKDTLGKTSRDTVREQLKQQKINTAFQPWIAQLQAKAKISYFIPHLEQPSL